ncbi:MAG: hypothetical protein KDA89_00575, partial [Planctomycetaceae bacterium]|nr:hypothetical protein [Planctomycetaceae bacterium]
MTNVITRSNGTRAVQFIDPRGKRRTISLGRISSDDATDIAFQVDRLTAASNAGGRIPLITKAWLADLPAKMHNKFAACGIIPGVAPEVDADPEPSVRLKDFLDEYIRQRSDVKESTATIYGHTYRCLIAFFGPDKPLADITAGDADAWRLWLAA